LVLNATFSIISAILLKVALNTELIRIKTYK
jgi:hypothetical protein